MTNMSRYEVRGVKFHRGHEGEPLAECGLYRDGVKVAVYSDGDWGGEPRFWWADKAAPRVEVKGLDFSGKAVSRQGTPEEALLAAHCAAIPQRDDPELRTKYNVTPDIFVGELVSEYDNAKRLARLCKDKTLFRVKGDKAGEYRVVKAPWSAKMKDWVVGKYGDAVEEILNEKMGQAAELRVS